MRLDHLRWVGLCVLLMLGVACGGDDDTPGPILDGSVGDGSDDGSLDAGTDAQDLPDAAPDATADQDAEVPDDAAVDAGTDAAVIEGVQYGKGSATAADSELGRALAIDGDTIVVGAPGESLGGAAYVFVRSNNAWFEQARLVAPTADTLDRFGGSVAIDGDTIVVGAVEERSNATGVNGDATDNSLTNAGAAYVFTRSGTSWTQQAYLKASNTGGNDNFGYAVAISGDTVAVSAHTEASSATGIDGAQTNGASFSGAVYVFTRTSNVWTQQAYVKASNTGQFDRFGVALDIDGNTLAVGAYYEDSLSPGINGDQSSNASPESGAVYVFTRDEDVWTQQAFVKASNCGAQDWFGGSVAVEGDLLVVGARQEDGLASDPVSDTSTNSGAAYVYQRAGTVWTELAYLKPTVSDSGDTFGTYVAIHEGVVAVGAMEEDSAGVFPDADPLDNTAENSGAAYLFEDIGAGYAQTRYIKASNTGTEDRFGAALALSTSRLVVGAFSEQSGNGNPNNNSAMNAGAFYAYDLP